MKYSKFNSVKLAIVVTILNSLMVVLTMNSLSLLKTNSKKELFIMIVLLSFLFLTSQIILYLKQYTKAISTYYIRRNYHKIADIKMLEKGIDINNKDNVGEKVALYINDVSRIMSLTYEKKFDMISNATVVIFAILSLFFINIYIGLLGIIMIGCILLTSIAMQKELTAAVSKSQAVSTKYIGGLTELFRGFSLMIELNIKNKFMSKSNKNSEEYSDKIAELDIYGGKISAILNFVSSIFVVFIIGGVSYFVIENKVGAGVLISVLGLVFSLGESTSMFYADRAFLKSGEEFLKEKFDESEIEYFPEFTKPFILRNHKITKVDRAKEERAEIKDINIENLSVKLGETKIEYKDLSFEAGKKYAICGKSGSGKSTLLKILLGHINDYAGKIIINGKEKEKAETLYDRVAYVSQESFVFDDTIENNFKLVAEDVNTDEVLKLVDLSDLKKDATLGENGSNISGGQKQRIAIARALLRGKNILFLDEITANLDPHSKEIIENLILSKDITVLWVTHDLTEANKNKFDYVIEL